ncbi:MAG: DUF4157 domain-containing protein [Alphaproteobacteria bacterium]|nr:DUF4157 domain-containing protein [Alphaproteobacteria bacterium]
MIRHLPLAVLVAVSLGLAASAQTTSRGAPALATAHDRLTDSFGRLAAGQVLFGANVLAATFEAALLRSRETARDGSEAIPDDIREALLPFYPAELLAEVRYKIGDVSPDGLAGFAIRNGNAAAVTLVDTIVFKNETHVKNLALWAHEIHHVHQYREWGTDGFAARYAFGWVDVENEATSRARDFVSWYKDRTASLR